MVLEKKGQPIFDRIDLTRDSDDIKDSDIEMLFKKADRCERKNLTTWLPNYFDDVPIGPATYAIRWMLYKNLKKHKNADHPMSSAWKELAPKAIDIVEFVMDIRKGDYSDEEITRRMKEITSKMGEIKTAQEEGDWFAKTVTAPRILDVPGFINTFDNLQSYVDKITGQVTLQSL